MRKSVITFIFIENNKVTMYCTPRFIFRFQQSPEYIDEVQANFLIMARGQIFNIPLLPCIYTIRDVLYHFAHINGSPKFPLQMCTN